MYCTTHRTAWRDALHAGGPAATAGVGKEGCNTFGAARCSGPDMFNPQGILQFEPRWVQRLLGDE